MRPHDSSLWATLFSGLLLLAVLATPVVIACWRTIWEAVVEIHEELYGRGVR